MLTAVLILNWNAGADTVICIRSLQQAIGPNDYVFVIDNGSTDNSLDVIISGLRAENISFVSAGTDELASSFNREIRHYVIKNPRNAGFGGGNNIVLSKLRNLSQDFRYAWLLNNDTIVESESLTTLQAAMMQNTKVAVAGSLILNLGDESTVQCAGVRYYPFFGVSKLVDKNVPVELVDPTKEKSIDYLNGASFMLDLETLEKVGYFDERFFLYSEEQDLQLRLQKYGYNIKLVKASRVFHKLSGGTSKSRHLFFYHYNRSAVLLLKKHFSKLQLVCGTVNLTLITFLRAFPGLKNVRWGLKGILSAFKS